MIYESKGDFLRQLNKLKSFKILGIDFGEKKSGLALYNSEVNVAIPLVVIKEIRKNLNSLLKCTQDKGINGMIIGLPLQLDGSTTENTQNIVEFAKMLDAKTKLPIILSDERFTTALANTLLKETNLKRKKRNQVDDAVAASILLENFFLLRCNESQRSYQ